MDGAGELVDQIVLLAGRSDSILVLDYLASQSRQSADCVLCQCRSR